MITPDPRRAVDDPLADVLRVVADLQHLQAAASVKYPFLDPPDMGRQTHLRKPGAFEKCLVEWNI